MTKFFIFPFADIGDKTPIPNAAQPSGLVSYAQGFTIDYTLPPENPAYQDVPRDQFNQLMYDTTSNIRQYQTHGVPEFITTTDNGGTPYPYDKGAIVRYDAGTPETPDVRNYQSLVDSNTNLPTNTAAWLWLTPMNYVQPGTIIAFGANTLLPGYLDATTANLYVERADYPALFSAIGTTWGSSTGTNFKLPGLAGRVLMGKGAGASDGIIGNNVANTGGERLHQLTIAELASHTHFLRKSAVGTQITTDEEFNKGGPIDGIESRATGGDQPHNNIQPSAIIYWQIKY